MDLIGKVAIVTGASAGVGRAYALALAGAGATVVAAARTLGQLDGEAPKRNTLAEVVHTAEGLPGRIFAEVCDVSVVRGSAIDHVSLARHLVENLWLFNLLTITYLLGF